jgi:hypothetical protein
MPAARPICLKPPLETFREEAGRAQASVSHGRASNLTQKQCRATQERAHSPLLLFRLRTDCLIDIERIRRLGFGVRLHEFRHDEYTRNRLLD